MKPRYFATPQAFRAWLAKHHATESELLVGFWKTHTGKPSITWPQSVDEALCVGWIDGVRKSTGDETYTIRFTPRRPGSIWSAVNTKRMQALVAEGRVLPPGLAAFELRKAEKSVVYSYENRPVRLPPDAEQRLKADPAAWAWWQAQAPWYRRTATWWVVSAKREQTREKRLAQLIGDCAAGRRIKPLSYKASGKEE